MAKGSDTRAACAPAPNLTAHRTHGPAGPNPWALSPSDFAFLWDECPRCMPYGVVRPGNRWVKSAPIRPRGHSAACFIRGYVDVLVHCDDGTTGILDFKTSEPKAERLATYGRQLHAYALSLEHPASGPTTTVGSLGLLCFVPGSYETEASQATLRGDVEWVEIERDDEGFLSFLSEVVSVLEQPEPHRPSGLPLVRLAARAPCRRLRPLGIKTLQGNAANPTGWVVQAGSQVEAGFGRSASPRADRCGTRLRSAR